MWGQCNRFSPCKVFPIRSYRLATCVALSVIHVREQRTLFIVAAVVNSIRYSHYCSGSGYQCAVTLYVPSFIPHLEDLGGGQFRGLGFGTINQKFRIGPYWVEVYMNM